MQNFLCARKVSFLCRREKTRKWESANVAIATLYGPVCLQIELSVWYADHGAAVKVHLDAAEGGVHARNIFQFRQTVQAAQGPGARRRESNEGEASTK